VKTNECPHDHHSNISIPPGVCIILGAMGSHPVWAVDAKAVALDAMSAYLEFVDYGGSTIFAEQIPKDAYVKMMILDTRDPDQFGKDCIPDAINIEWGQVLAKSAQIPKNKPVLVYCDTGSLSAQVGFALRVTGWGNVRILQGEYTEWKAKGGMDANLKATASPQQ
jgi:rhodanese-related sulfurtransferase